MTTTADLIVVGSGVAGLAAALHAAAEGAHVALLTGGALLAGSSARAQGGVAAAIGADDAPSLHAADTHAVGGGLNDRTAVDVLVDEGRRSVLALLSDGVPFDGTRDAPELGLEAGHQRRRILHAGGGDTGRILTESLIARAVVHPRVSVFERTPSDALVCDDGNARVMGVRSGRHSFQGRAVVLATGGYGALWARTTNGPETRGAGVLQAWRAGASLADLEFVQFHPTALCVPGRPAFLLSEALRGEGARLVDARDRDVVDPLLPRDVVARALHRYRREHDGEGPFLSLRHLDASFVRRRFPNLARIVAEEYGLDLATDLLPVAPAAHYCMGGIRTDTWGRTDVAGLYAAGEAACTGVQGANRLASNSLLECLVFGQRAAAAALSDAPTTHAVWHTRELPTGAARLPATGEQPHTVMDRGVLAERLERDLGVERDATRLGALIQDLPDPEHADHVRASADLQLAALAARAAYLRAESRGAHFRTDYPDTDPRWRSRMHWQRGSATPRLEEVAPV